MRMNLRRAAIAGGIVALIGSSAVAATSPTPVPTFLYVLAVAGGMWLIALGVLVLIDRRGRRERLD
jgi:hypothetical protein